MTSSGPTIRFTDDALNRAQRAISLAPDSFQARFALAHVYEEHWRPLPTASACSVSCSRNGRSTAGAALSGQFAGLHGQLAEALAISTRAVAALPQDAYSWSKNAMILAELGRTARLWSQPRKRSPCAEVHRNSGPKPRS